VGLARHQQQLVVAGHLERVHGGHARHAGPASEAGQLQAQALATVHRQWQAREHVRVGEAVQAEMRWWARADDRSAVYNADTEHP